MSAIDCWTWSFEGNGANELNALLAGLRDKARFIVAARKVSEEARRRTGGLGEEEARMKEEVLKEQASHVALAKAALHAIESSNYKEEAPSPEKIRRAIEDFVVAMEALKAGVAEKQALLEEYQNRGREALISF